MRALRRCARLRQPAPAARAPHPGVHGAWGHVHAPAGACASLASIQLRTSYTEIGKDSMTKMPPMNHAASHGYHA
eukprot:364833-Chlamydomonas_euryale.AAC.6